MKTGIAASKGYAIGYVYKMEDEVIEVSQSKIEDTEKELDYLNSAKAKAAEQLEAIRKKAEVEVGEEEAEVFASHLLMLDDPEFIGLINQNILDKKMNAACAANEATTYYASVLGSMDNEYLKARAADIKDVGKRLVRICLGKGDSAHDMPENAIVFAEDLTPSDTASLDKNKVLGFVTEVGSKTSHSAIMARSMGIPAILGINGIMSELENGQKVIIDGTEGFVYLEPTEELETKYEALIKDMLERKEKLQSFKEAHFTYSSGRKLEVCANIGGVDDLAVLLEQGAEGVGLFRTEFLFMGRDKKPTEDEQYEVYKTVAEKMEGKPVVVRTLDIGGDKVIPYIELEKEDNPFLGVRALRLCMQELELFKTQLRAILRASIYGDLKIMFPMVGSLKELTDAKAVLESCKKALDAEGIKYNKDISVGIMIEIPAAAVISRQLAKEVDFFSIGTNDLTQYTLAVDRMNANIAHLYNSFHPAVLELIKMSIESAHAEGIWCGMCGEFASDLKAISILSSMELDEFSVTGSMVLEVKEALSKQANVVKA